MMTHRAGSWVLPLFVLVAASSFAAAQQPPQNFILHDTPRPVAGVV